MTKLSKEMRERVKAADADPFAPLPKGFYILKLTKVTSGKSNSSGNQMWTWFYKSVEPIEGKEVRDYSAFSTEWKFKQIFNAFGVSEDIDTDDLLGQTVIAEIDHQPDQKNPNRMRHYVAGYPDQSVTKPTLFDEPEPEKAPAKKSSSRKKDDGDEKVPF